MKKKYKKPEIVFEKLAFKSALATCGYISTRRISEDSFSCEIVESEGDLKWPGGKGEPAYNEDFDVVLIDSGFKFCSTGYECYHVPQGAMMEGENSAYIGLS